MTDEIKAALPSPLTRKALRSKLATHHGPHGQRAKLAELALSEAFGALDKLNALGHNFVLVEGTAPKVVEYPKAVTVAGKTVIVKSREEEDAAKRPS